MKRFARLNSHDAAWVCFFGKPSHIKHFHEITVWDVAIMSSHLLSTGHVILRLLNSIEVIHTVDPQLSLNPLGGTPSFFWHTLDVANICSQKVPSSKMSSRKMEPLWPLKKSNSEAWRKDGEISEFLWAFLIQCRDIAMAIVRATWFFPAPGSPWKPIAFSEREGMRGASARRKHTSRSFKVKGQCSWTYASTPSVAKLRKDFSTSTVCHL